MKTTITMRSSMNPLVVFQCNLNLEGTEKQIAYAVSIINKKIDKTDSICQNMIRSGKMTIEEYHNGMNNLLKQFESLTSAKYVIENVK